ncbi:hypothetical protein WJX73_009847 [Symbiochloris irregularis]|uniref:Uncharacterized protein n=1 Tax=Symbiochloris irregularis TaxID=706552 RepID=A0AAW1PZH5_9CHLO
MVDEGKPPETAMQDHTLAREMQGAVSMGDGPENADGLRDTPGGAQAPPNSAPVTTPELVDQLLQHRVAAAFAGAPTVAAEGQPGEVLLASQQQEEEEKVDLLHTAGDVMPQAQAGNSLEPSTLLHPQGGVTGTVTQSHPASAPVLQCSQQLQDPGQNVPMGDWSSSASSSQANSAVEAHQQQAISLPGEAQVHCPAGGAAGKRQRVDTSSDRPFAPMRLESEEHPQEHYYDFGGDCFSLGVPPPSKQGGAKGKGGAKSCIKPSGKALGRAEAALGQAGSAAPASTGAGGQGASCAANISSCPLLISDPSTSAGGPVPNPSGTASGAAPAATAKQLDDVMALLGELGQILSQVDSLGADMAAMVSGLANLNLASTATPNNNHISNNIPTTSNPPRRLRSQARAEKENEGASGQQGPNGKAAKGDMQGAGGNKSDPSHGSKGRRGKRK